MASHRWECARRFVSRGAVAVAGASSMLASTAIAVADRSGTLLLSLSALALALGAHRLLRAIVHRADPAYRADLELDQLTLQDVQLAIAWVVCSGLLIGAASVHLPPLAVAPTGVVLLVPVVLRALALTADIARRQGDLEIPGARAFLAQTERGKRWIERAERSDQLPGARAFIRLFERREPRNQMTRHTARMLLALVCVAVAYAGVAAAQVVVLAVGHSDEKQQDQQDQTGPLSYEQLCPRLPDPLDVGHRLGELFQHDGAVQAGCAGQARQVADEVPVWVSEGWCEDELRSLAVSFPGGAALLYGQAARFARARADDGTLRFAERAPLGGGEVAIIGTIGGTHVLVRVTPSMRPGSSRARRCEDVDEVARPFAVLRPALAGLWLQYVRVHGWTWPLPDPDRGPTAVAFLDPASDHVVAHGSCSEDGTCRLSDVDGETTWSGFASISIADLAPYAP
jgi:hypothetical protein